jgi:hypothetical protein
VIHPSPKFHLSGKRVILPQSEANSKMRFQTVKRVDSGRRIETYVWALIARVAPYSERANRIAGWKPAYGLWRSISTTSERSCTRSRTTSRPSGEMSKSRISKSGVRLVNCRSAPVFRSMSQRFLC